MLISKEVEIKLNGKNIKYYEDLGYEIPRRKDKWGEITVSRGTTIMVKVEDLPDGSHAEIQCLCDYCLERGIKTIINKIYKNYIKGNKKSVIHKDCCNECASLKNKESILLQYNVENIFQLEYIKEKSKQTNLQKYGVKNPLQNNEIKRKAIKTNIEKYGCENVFQNKNIKQKSKQTCLQKYGAEYYRQTEEGKKRYEETCLKKYGKTNYTQTEEYKIKVKITNLERYGVEWGLQNEEIRSKGRITLRNNGNCPTSSQQRKIYNLLKENDYNVELNYPISYLNLDIAIFVNNIKIDLEYDGYFWHKDQQKDRRRDEFLKSQGWKILRIKSGHKISLLKEIINSINKLINTDRTFTQIILDDWKLNNKEVI